jgi:hypothetical protein
MTTAAVDMELCVPRSQSGDTLVRLTQIDGITIVDCRDEPEFGVDSFITVRLIVDEADDPFTTMLAVTQEARYLSVALVTVEV